MLRELKILNYAIIESLDIAFHPGLNIITGETGAGKSILLGALGLLGGNRADSSMIRTGAGSCVIEALFEIAPYRHSLQPIFTENDLDWADSVTIRRTISAAGKSRAFVDDLPVNLTILKSITDKLIDIHSQHQTLLLAGSSFQTRIVDAVAGHQSLLERYAAHYRELNRLRGELNRLEREAAEAVRERDYLQFQLDRLTELNLQPGEAAELETEQNLLTHAEEIAGLLDLCNVTLTDDEHGVNVMAKSLVSTLNRLSAHYPDATELASRMESVYLELKDLAEECGSRRDHIEINPRRLEAVNERLDAIFSTAQKHQAENDPERLVTIRGELEDKLHAFDAGDEHIVQLRKQIAELLHVTTEEAARLTKGRQQAVPRIVKHVERTLEELGIKGAAFRIDITPLSDLAPGGADRIEMLFSGNAGSLPQPIENVASGGEMSRVMLALKELVARSTEMPTILFDEIDTGVSGRVADKMGEIIARMAGSMQVLNITHLPQIASKGEHHYFVYKDTNDSGATGTHIRELNPSERIEHIATMLSGSDITDAARTQATELLKNNRPAERRPDRK